jgi:tetratricopeptide (TPR) repeat protein
MYKPIQILLILLVLFPPAFLHAQEKESRRNRHKTKDSNTMIDKKAATEVFLDGSKAKMLGDINKAAILFNQSLELNPGNDAALYELSQIFFEQGDFATAANYVEKALSIDPENQYYRLLALDIYGKSGRKDDLLKTCQQLLKKEPGNVDYMYELASAYLQMGKYDDALKTYNSIEAIMGVTEEVSMQKQRIYMLLKKTDKAVKEMEGLIESFPEESARYYSMLAEIYMQEDKPDIAAGYYRKVLDVDPDNPYVHISLSDYYRKKGDAVQSFEELKTGFANPALDVDTKIRILTAYYNIQEIYNDKKEEVSLLSQIIMDAHPGDAKALSLNGDMLLTSLKYKEARDCYQRVLAIDSSRYSVWASLMQADASLMDWKSLMDVSTRAQDLFPLQPLPYFFNGVSRLQLKKPAEAIEVLKSCAKLIASDEQLLSQVYTYLGDAYQQTKQYALSDESYDKALKLEPENTYVLNNYAYYLSLRGENLDKALIMSKKGASLDSLNPANLDTYGWVLYKMGNFTEAKIWVGKAISNSSKDDPDILEHYGDILYKLGEKSASLEYWKKALNAGTGSEFLERKVKEKRIIE